MGRKRVVRAMLTVCNIALFVWSAAGPRIAVSAEAAPESGDTSGAPVIAPLADKLLREMGSYLKTAKQFTFHAEIASDELLPSGQKIQYGASNSVFVRRPDRLHAASQSDLGSKRFWYDGKSMTLLDLDERFYATVEAPPEIDEAMDHLMERYGFAPPLADLVYKDPYAAVIENVQFGFYVGLHNVEGVACHHLAFVQKFIDWQIWIEDGKQLVPRKVLITYKTMPESPQFTAILSEWDFQTRLSDALFTADFPPTADYERIEFLALEEPETDKK
jgi:hypothetical protein